MSVCPPPPISARLPGGDAAPYWSVMMPTYNPRRDMLEIALKSVLAQAPGPDEMEIVVVDDASPNGSPESWVREIAGDRVAFVRLPQNLGLARVWNRCIGLAHGEWVHILHQDDVLQPGYYALLRRGIEAAPDVGAAFCRFSYIDDDGSVQETAPAHSGTPGPLVDFLPAVATGPHVVCASISVKRSVYEEIGGFRPDLTHALDWEMWIRIANRHPIHYEPAVLASWRRHDSATTSRQILTGENVRDIARTIRVWRSYVPGHLADDLARRASAFWANEGLTLAEVFLNRGDLAIFMAQWKAALACDRSAATLRRAARLGWRAGTKLARKTARRLIQPRASSR